MGVIDDSKNYLRPNQVTDMESRLNMLEKQLHNPYVKDKGAVVSSRRALEHDLRTQAPPELQGLELDQVVKEEKDLRKEITENMLSAEEMRKNPPGAVGRNLTWHERFVKSGKVRAWKNRILALNRGSNDPDLANLERFRPATSQLNMDNAQIPGQDYSFPSEQYKVNYDKMQWEHKQSREEMQSEVDLLKAQLADLKDQTAGVPVEAAGMGGIPTEVAPPTNPNKGGGWTPERRAAHSAMMKERYRKQQEAKAQEVSDGTV